MNGANGPGMEVTHQMTGDRVGALYVNPDGTFEVSIVTTAPAYHVTGRQPGNRKMTFAADRWEPRTAPTWQEAAEATRPYLPALPPAAREAYARVLLSDAEEIAWSMTLSYPVPFRFAEDFTRALITSACEALRHGDQAAAVCPNPDGTYEVTGIRIPPVWRRSRCPWRPPVFPPSPIAPAPGARDDHREP